MVWPRPTTSRRVCPAWSELFEARQPKGRSPISEAAGRVEIEETDKARKVLVTPDDGSEVQEYPVSKRSRLLVADGDHIEVGQQLTAGTPDPQEVLRILGVRKAQEHLVDEVQAVYRSQGVAIHDKHIEIIVRQMLRRVTVIESGDTNLLPVRPGRPGALRGGEPSGGLRGRQARLGSSGADGHHQGVARHRVVALGGLLPGDDPRAHRRGDPRHAPTRLRGLKENVIIGKLIPAGTGLERYRNIRVEPTEEARAAAYSVTGYDSYDYEFGNTGRPGRRAGRLRLRFLPELIVVSALAARHSSARRPLPRGGPASALPGTSANASPAVLGGRWDF